VEGTAGNTGLGLALVAAQKGYRLILVIPDKMSREKISNLRAMGAKVVLTRSDVAKGHPEYYQDLAQSMANEIEGAFFINQFGNPSNPRAHEEVTGPEIWQQMDHDLDAIVLGVGSSGTITGLSRYFEKAAPGLEIIIADPVGSILAEYVNDGVLSVKTGSWLVEGIGEDFLPGISDFTRVTKAYSISDAESMLTGRELLNREGVLGGSSTGTLVAAALRYCREQTVPKKVLTFACDTGNRYLSKMYNDYWMRDQGFIQTSQHGDLRDLIARPFESNDTITVGPDEPLASAYSRMKLYDVSQLPVIENRNIVGFIDESDILLAVGQSSASFNQPVKTAMVTELALVSVTDPIDKLLPIFNRDYVAIVKDGERFLGLITRVDLLNYLRRKADH
jgi:cystathionine beta-synthase